MVPLHHSRTRPQCRDPHEENPVNPKERLAALLGEMRTIVTNAKSAHRDLSPGEVADLEAKNAEVDRLKAQIERGNESAALMDRIGGLRDSGEQPTSHAPKAAQTASWARKAVDGLATLASRAPGGAKALTSGTVSVPALVGGVSIDSSARTLLDLVTVLPARDGGETDSDSGELDFVGRGGHVGNVFSFVRQTARQSNARAVPDGAEKPTSTYTFGQVDDTYRVYANKTEDLAWRYLADFEGLMQIISTQLRDDTLSAIERDVLSGDGEDDRFTGIDHTEGVQVQAFEGDLLTTLSAAKYKLLAQDRQLTGWAMNPLDLQSLEMLRENGTTGAFLFKSRSEIEGFLGAPVVTSLGLSVGSAIAADWSQAELLPVGDDELVFDGKNRTENNTFRLMYEGRYGFRVKRPFDFVQVQVTEA
ncbi:phage major capsid protein [Microbacterium sp. EYE_5]|uniref:phage major capsid protein n=1 Tax=unclassified Microbacterium TaxID=2609290 RepID=UPI002003C90A|nr:MULTISPECIES: phage major capsid protein [unclassified Microbacterium]MCK6080978.1 phage major capsid protein [Microbacterium sp. EYE_382]MCK6086248.1 phage major capsid protein [Microbacterium sp. EYE_384]MCK6124254.1 phage major capsid protein [Microbacterium sp. EYE_80]MCK6127163.1 phage major capsid protein [Microbacterium sp. EYE_79]MCK6141933.1 phage major capsid protein [Microbacterium sp. EYE_39]